MILILSTVAACEDEAALTEPKFGGQEAPINTIVGAGPLNAQSNDTLVAFSLSKNMIVPRSGDWDVLFRRYEIRVNSAATAGTATKNVTAYAMGNSQAKTAAEVLAFTPANTLAAFDAVRATSIPADTFFKADRLIENKYGYLNLAGAPTANAANYWKVKTALGGYAVAHVTAITLGAQSSLVSVTIESRVQTGATLGQAQTRVVSLAGAQATFSIATNDVVTPNGCNWDLRIDPTTLEITTNSACGAGTFPGGSSPTFANETSASDAPQYALHLSSLNGPIPNSITDTAAPFRYNLLNTQRLHPSFNTYLIKVGAKVYKLQVINYYNDSGASGFPTIRSARIQ